jgi:hypothetical protein
MHVKEGNLTENQNFLQNNQPMKKTQVCSWLMSIAFCRKAKTKVETSSLRNLKIMRRKYASNAQWYTMYNVLYIQL